MLLDGVCRYALIARATLPDVWCVLRPPLCINRGYSPLGRKGCRGRRHWPSVSRWPPAWNWLVRSFSAAWLGGWHGVMAASAFEKCQLMFEMLLMLMMVSMLMVSMLSSNVYFTSLFRNMMVMSMMILVMVIQPRSVADLFRGEFEEDQRWRLADWKRPRGADHVFYLGSQETKPILLFQQNQREFWRSLIGEPFLSLLMLLIIIILWRHVWAFGRLGAAWLMPSVMHP